MTLGESAAHVISRTTIAQHSESLGWLTMRKNNKAVIEKVKAFSPDHFTIEHRVR